LEAGQFHTGLARIFTPRIFSQRPLQPSGHDQPRPAGGSSNATSPGTPADGIDAACVRSREPIELAVPSRTTAPCPA
jgi:hypothetical protein